MDPIERARALLQHLDEQEELERQRPHRLHPEAARLAAATGQDPYELSAAFFASDQYAVERKECERAEMPQREKQRPQPQTQRQAEAAQRREQEAMRRRYPQWPMVTKHDLLAEALDVFHGEKE